MSTSSSIKEAIAKAKFAMTGEEPTKESMTIKNLKESMTHLKSAQANYKLAQEGGEMGPDEAAATAQDIAQLGEQIAQNAMAIVAGVPSSEGGEMGMNTPSPMGNEQAPNPMEKKENPMASGMGEEKEKEDPEKVMSAMRDEIDGMKKEKEQMKLSQRYGEAFPEGMRQARAEEFATRQAPMNVLLAQVVEAESNLSGKVQQAMKVAQKGDKPYDIPDEKEVVEVGGKY